MDFSVPEAINTSVSLIPSTVHTIAIRMDITLKMLLEKTSREKWLCFWTKMKLWRFRHGTLSIGGEELHIQPLEQAQAGRCLSRHSPQWKKHPPSGGYVGAVRAWSCRLRASLVSVADEETNGAPDWARTYRYELVFVHG